MATIVRHLPGQARVPYLAPDRVAAARDERVRAVVAHAVASVPYYRDLGLDPAELRGAADLARLPLLDKETVRADPDRFRSTAATRAVRLRTWGSTGLGLDVWHDRRSLLQNVAFSERERAVERTLVGRRTGYAILHVSRSGSTARSVRGFYDASAFRPFRPRRHLIPVDAPLDEVVATIASVRPLVVEGYGAYLETLFRTLAARGIELPHRPRVVVYGAERMSAQGRRLIERRFGIRVLSRYAAVEALKIGFTCEEGRGFHLHEDLCHVRLVDPAGRPTAPGETGEVVISNLVNRATVLLNYRLGDLAGLRDRGCPCGRTSLVLDELAGRTAQVVGLADGTLVHETALAAAVLEADGVIRSRIVQTARARFELLLETADQATFDRAAGIAVPRLRDALHGAEVAVRRAETLAPADGGKATPIVALPLERP